MLRATRQQPPPHRMLQPADTLGVPVTRACKHANLSAVPASWSPAPGRRGSLALRLSAGPGQCLRGGGTIEIRPVTCPRPPACSVPGSPKMMLAARTSAAKAANPDAASRLPMLTGGRLV